MVYCCLATFTALLALKQDDSLSWTYWAVFSPLWLWKCLVVAGALVGIIVWFRYPEYRLEGDGYLHFKALLICLSLHLLLLMFEVLVCDQLTLTASMTPLTRPRHMWTLVFVPLVFVSIVSVVVCVWALKNDRSCELELCCAVNVLQFVFVALKLDELVTWSWEVVLVPLWIVMCVSVVGLLYALIFAALLLRSSTVSTQQRRGSAHAALGHGFLVLPMLAFLVLLSNKLDGLSDVSWIITVSPLFLTYFTLILLSFNSKPNNIWWFGLRRDFCTLLFDVFPCLREYCNVSLGAVGGATAAAGDSVSADASSPGSPVCSTGSSCSVTSLSMKRQETAVPPPVSMDVPD